MENFVGILILALVVVAGYIGYYHGDALLAGMDSGIEKLNLDKITPYD